MVTVPPETPVTTPVLPTVASKVLLLLQLPPVTVSLKLIVAPLHTVGPPLIVPAYSSIGEMVTENVIAAVSAPSLILISKLSVPL